MKYTVIIPFVGAVNKEVEAETEDEALDIIEKGLVSGQVEITDEEFASSAEVEDPYILA